jgi:branched-chain amino acid transport system permease protein
MITTILDVVIDGLLMGGIYALISMGLSLQYGVARVLNVAHGEFLMLGAFITWVLFSNFGISPLISIFISGPGMFIIGYFLYRSLFTTLRASSPNVGIFESKSMLAAFGLLFVIQNIALIIWTANLRSYSYLNIGVSIGGALFAANRLVTLGFAVVIGFIFYFFLTYTRMGKAIRASAQDSTIAGLMGVNIKNILAVCFGLGAAMAGIAGSLISMSYPINAVMGLGYTIIAIIVVVLGGLGSIPGSFIGGFILGVIGSIVTHIEPGLALAAYYIIFMLLLLLRPTGIMGKSR